MATAAQIAEPADDLHGLPTAMRPPPPRDALPAAAPPPAPHDAHVTVDAAAEVALYGRLSTTTAPLTAHVSIVATSSTTVKLTIVDARNSIRDLDTGELITVDELERRESARLSRGSSAFDLSAVSNNSSKALERRLRDVGDIVFMRHTVRDLDTGEIIDVDELERRTPHPESAFDLSAVAPHRAHRRPRAPQTAADDSPDAQAHRALFGRMVSTLGELTAGFVARGVAQQRRNPDSLGALEEEAAAAATAGELAQGFGVVERLVEEWVPPDGELKAAEAACRAARDAVGARYGGGHALSLALTGHLAALLQERRRYGAASNELCAAIEAAAAGSPPSFMLLGRLATVLWDSERFDDAERVYWTVIDGCREAIERADSLDPTEDAEAALAQLLERLLDALEGLAWMLAQQGAVDDAESLLHEALDTAEAAYGADHAETERAQASLAELLRLRATSSKATFTV